MVTGTRVISRTTRKVDKVNSPGQMVESMTENGLQVNNMELVITLTKMVWLEQVSGIKERERSGRRWNRLLQIYLLRT